MDAVVAGLINNLYTATCYINYSLEMGLNQSISTQFHNLHNETLFTMMITIQRHQPFCFFGGGSAGCWCCINLHFRSNCAVHEVKDAYFA